MATQYPIINGVKFDWSSIEIDLNGTIFTGCTELAYKQTREIGDVYGTGAEKLARTLGQLNAEGTLAMYRRDFQDFINLLTGNGQTGYLDTEFDITASYSAPNGDGILTDRCISCVILEPDISGSQGTDPLMVTCSLDILRVELDGILPITNMLV